MDSLISKIKVKVAANLLNKIKTSLRSTLYQREQLQIWIQDKEKYKIDYMDNIKSYKLRENIKKNS